MQKVKTSLAKIPFDKLPEILINQAEAMVFNPMGFNLILNKEQLRRFLADKNDIMIIRQVVNRLPVFICLLPKSAVCATICITLKKQWETDGNGH